jgi:hypothetical protein
MVSIPTKVVMRRVSGDEPELFLHDLLDEVLTKMLTKMLR